MTAISSQGLQLHVGDGAATEVFTSIGNITDVSYAGGGATEIDSSDLDSDAKEFILGLRDNGSVTFTLNYLPTDTKQKSLITDMNAKTLRSFKVIYPDGVSEMGFSAFVMNFDPQGAVDAKMTANVTLRVSGAVDWPA